MDNVIIALIGLAAVFYLGRKAYRSLSGKEGCGCGCEGCHSASNKSGTPSCCSGSKPEGTTAK